MSQKKDQRYFQELIDLMDLAPTVLKERLEKLEAFEKEHALVLPGAFKELYSYEFFPSQLEEGGYYEIEELEILEDKIIFRDIEEGLAFVAFALDGSNNPPVYIRDENTETECWGYRMDHLSDLVLNSEIENALYFLCESEATHKTKPTRESLMVIEKHFTKLITYYGDDSEYFFYSRNKSIKIGMRYESNPVTYYNICAKTKEDLLELKEFTISIFTYLKNLF